MEKQSRVLRRRDDTIRCRTGSQCLFGLEVISARDYDTISVLDLRHRSSAAFAGPGRPTGVTILCFGGGSRFVEDVGWWRPRALGSYVDGIGRALLLIYPDSVFEIVYLIELGRVIDCR